MKNFLILNIPPPYGGGEIRAQLLYEYFKDRNGYQTFIYTNKWRSKSTQGLTSLTNILHNLRFILLYSFYVIKSQPSVVFISLPKTFITLFKVFPILVLKTIFRFKLLGELAGSSFYFLESNFIIQKICISSLRKFDSIRVLGDATLQYLNNYGISNGYVMDNGVQIPHTGLRIAKRFKEGQMPHLLFVGALNKEKGIFVLSEIADLLQQNKIEFIFDIVGEWSSKQERDEFHHLINLKGIDGRFKFHGLQINDSKWDLFLNADLFIFPSFNEGQPITILEALAFGLPIVSSNVGLIPETIKDGINGLIINGNKGSDFLNGINRLLSNRDLYEKISKNNIELYNKRFTAEIYTRSFQIWLNSFNKENVAVNAKTH